MRASQFTAGIFAGALALLSVMSTVEKPFDAKGESDWEETTQWEETTAPYIAPTTAPPPTTTEPKTGEFYYATPSYDPTVSRTTPSAFTVTWRYVRMPNRDASASGYSEKYGYVLEPGNGIRDPQNSADFLSTQQVQYVEKDSCTEVFDLRDFDPSGNPQLYTIESFYTDQLKALLKSVNQAIKDDFARKKTAYEIWQKMITAPTDKYPDTPSAYTVTWESIRLPVTKEMVDSGFYTLRREEPTDNGYPLSTTEPNTAPTVFVSKGPDSIHDSGYVIEPGAGIADPNNRDCRIATWQVRYIEVTNYTETFDFHYFDPDEKPPLYDVSNLLKQAAPARWALNTSINEAILSDHERKVAAFKRWRSEVENGTYQPTAPSAFATTEPTTRIYYDPTEPTNPPATDPTQPTTNTGSDLSRGDINHDGYINAKDASILLRYAAAYGAGLNPKLDDFLD